MPSGLPAPVTIPLRDSSSARMTLHSPTVPMKILLGGALAVLLLAAQTARGTTTIDPTNKYAWAANIGFTNWRPSDANGVAINNNFETFRRTSVSNQ
ncbi:MAG: hypothetical protein QOJ87_1315 [Verrucomicrobiota bacterium]